MKDKKVRFSLAFALLSLLIFTLPSSAQDGAKLFKQNCAVCHDSHSDRKGTGPGLKGVFDRAPKGDWIHKWILNTEKMIKSGDAYANKIYLDNGKAQMTVFEGQLDDKQVESIIAFIQGPPPGPAVAAAGPSSGGGAAAETQGGIDPLYLILGVIVILCILLFALRSVRIAMQNTSEAAEGKGAQREMGLIEETKHWMAGNRRFVGVICIVVGCIAMKSCWDACFNIGVYYDYRTQKGYLPDQPIKFSHKLHAGDNEIACQYCHNSVEKSRHAGIPTINICMNCHKGIQSGPQYGEREIAKIYNAAGFDPKAGTYNSSKQNPLKWVKVHNLPDHVYFNHSQHVVVGKLDCNNCHGNVKEMTVVEQKAPLTMKWCIECHRKTEVAMAGNAYYDRLHAALKAKYAGQYDERMTVDKIGGLECTKCHY